MALNSINTNLAAYSAQTNIGKASNSASASIARLSSGNRITKASDDVAALSIGTSLRTGVTTLKTALLNASQGSSLLAVADGALSQISEILQRQKAIAVQAGSGSLGATERGYLDQEFQNLAKEIDRIAGSTNFNGVKLINGGMGSPVTLANTNALAAAFDPTTASQNSTSLTAAASITPVGAFNVQTGAELNGVAAAGELEITDSGGTILANAAYLGVNPALVGQFESFELSNIVYGTSATLTASINGLEFTGTVNNAGTTALLKNGNTYINLRFTAVTLTNAGTASNSQAQLAKDFANTVIQRTNTIAGVEFDGTRLEGAEGAAATGVAMGRFSSTTVDIGTFTYAGNTGAANTSAITVDINGKTFTARGVLDAVAAANGKLTFQSEDSQVLIVDLTGLTTDFTNIRTNADQQKGLIDALNLGFSRAGAGLSFQVGSTSKDSLRVSIDAANSLNLYGGATLSVGDAASAATAVDALDVAIGKVTSLRADVGALQSRFNFASANIETSIQNQDAARGVLLDTDVAGESTAYATAQVQMQAGIAVLAQANQLPQNLLKLIS